MADSKSNKKSKSIAEVQADLRALSKSNPKSAEAAAKPGLDIKKALLRVGLVVVALWILAIATRQWSHANWPLYLVAVLTVIAAAAGTWVYRYVQKAQQLGAILQGVDSDEGRKGALAQIEAGFKKGDVQASLAKAQLEMQEDPRKAIATLEAVDLTRQLSPVADQVRSMRAMLHLTLGETEPARRLVDAMELGKQQDAKTRAMFATVAGEAWGRTGEGKKAVETLELFNPEDPEFGEMRVQMWRARAFAYASSSDMKGTIRALKKLSEISPQLLMMFVGQKRIHPMLEKEARQILMRSGAVPRKFSRKAL